MQYKLKIGEVRRSKRITQKHLATTIGVSQTYLSEIENGKHDIKLSMLVKIADVLGEHPRDLYDK